jgi:hypothetical protein
MTTLMERTASTPEEWHAAITAVYQAGKAMFDDDKRPHVELTAEGDTLTLRQLRFLHGPVFGQIAEQVFVNGQQFDKETWKRYLKERFIPDEFEMVQLPFVVDKATGALRPSVRPVPRKKEKSLLDLKNEKRSEFIDQVLAYAATDLGVEFVFTFDEREAVRYRPPLRKAQKATADRGEAVPA